MVLRDFPYQSLERQPPNEELRGLLVLSNFSERDRTRTVSVRPRNASRTESTAYPGRLRNSSDTLISDVVQVRVSLELLMLIVENLMWTGRHLGARHSFLNVVKVSFTFFP